MTKEHADTLTKAILNAETEEERNHAIALAIVALVDCQHKTAKRVKMLCTYAIVFAVAIAISAGSGTNLIQQLFKITGAL